MSEGNRFSDFFYSYEDETGQHIYIQAMRSMIAEDKTLLKIDFDHLIRFDPQLAKDLIDDPDYYIVAATEAQKEIIENEDEEFLQRIRTVHPCFVNPPKHTHVSLRKIRAANIGRFISVPGIITRTTEVRPLLVEAAFKCIPCGEKIVRPQQDGRYSPPFQCPNPECQRKGPFNLIESESEFIDWQRMVIQERPEDLTSGQLPQNFSAVILGDLVDAARPGDRVRLNGVLRSQPFRALKRGQVATYNKFLEANSVEREEEEYEEIIITDEDRARIEELSRDPFIIRKIIESIAPSIYGYAEIKEAIGLLLFGGTPKVTDDGMKIRGESNILLVGDPGVGKSQIIRYVVDLAPRGVYTSGKGASAAGLTAAVIREGDTGEMTLEAGALVLADKGICGIDEFDKMSNEDRVAIHEALEQHTISIAKAGIIATLNARTSVLAAANPKLGRFNPFKDPIENVNLPPTLLSRFDLLFIMQDRPDVDMDAQKAEHILNLHRTGTTDREPPIPTDFLTKYIAYARQNFFPKLSEEASERILEYYKDLRAQSHSSEEEGGAPMVAITPRQLEAVVRLSEARAKMGLRDEVLYEDASAVIRLFEFCMNQLGRDLETGARDVDRFMTGQSTRTRSRIVRIEEIVYQVEKRSDEGGKIADIVKETEGQGLDERDVLKVIEDMKRDGLLYEPKEGWVKKI